MADAPDAAHIIFPGDAPPAPPTALYADAPAIRLNVEPSQSGDALKDVASTPAGKPADDPAATLFKADAAEAASFKPAVVEGLIDPFRMTAIQEGDTERAAALKVASEGIAADFAKAGTSTQDAESAFAILREANDHIVPPPPEKIEADMKAGLAMLQSELGASFQSDLRIAQAFIRDLEKVAPGTIESLQHNGSGNDLRLVRAAIKEAKKRGYR